MVTTDTEQSISGSKTFTSPVIIGASGYDIKKDGSNIVIEADGNDIKIRGGLTPNANATYSIGTNALKWANMHLNNALLLGNNTTAAQGQITFKNPDLTNQGNWYITSPDQNSIRFMQDTQNTGICLARGTFYPLSDSYFSLGSSSYRWKSLNLSHYVDWGNNVFIGKDSSNRFYVSGSDGTIKLKIGASESLCATKFSPDSSNSYDLGRTGLRWNYGYINYLVGSDDTVIPTSDIALKSTSSATEVFAQGYLDKTNGNVLIDTSVTGMPDAGIYMFTYGYAQAMFYLDSDILLAINAGEVLRVACPVLIKEGSGTVSGATGNMKIEKTSTPGVFKLTVASTISGAARSEYASDTNGWGFKLIKTGL